MSEKEQNDYPQLAYFYRIALATGLSKEKSKLFAAGQISKEHNINHLRVIEL